MIDDRAVPIIVVDNYWLFVSHAWSIIGRCRRIDPGHVARSDRWPTAGRLSDDGWFRFYWVRSAERLGDLLRDSPPELAARAWILLDLCDEKGRIDDAIKTVRLVADQPGLHPDRLWVFSAYRTPRRELRTLAARRLGEPRHGPWSRRLMEVRPKTPDALEALRADLVARHPSMQHEHSPTSPSQRHASAPTMTPSEPSEPSEPYSGHILISGLMFDERSSAAEDPENSEGELGLPPRERLYEQLADHCFGHAQAPRETSLGEWWERQVEQRINAQLRPARETTADRLRARIHQTEQRVRDRACQLLRRYDWGISPATLSAAGQGWPIWLCLSPMRFAERAARVGPGDHGWQIVAPSGRRVTKQADDAARAGSPVSDESLARARAAVLSPEPSHPGSRRPRASRPIFKLAGDVGGPTSVALGDLDMGIKAPDERKRSFDLLREALALYEESDVSPWDAGFMLSEVLGREKHRDRRDIADFVGLRLTAEATISRYLETLDPPVMYWHVIGEPVYEDTLLRMVRRLLEHRVEASHVFILVDVTKRFTGMLQSCLKARVDASGHGAFADAPYARGWHIASSELSPVRYLTRISQHRPPDRGWYAWAESMGLRHEWGAGLLPDFEQQLLDTLIGSHGRDIEIQLLAFNYMSEELRRRNLLTDAHERESWSLRATRRRLRTLALKWPEGLGLWMERFRQGMGPRPLWPPPEYTRGEGPSERGDADGSGEAPAPPRDVAEHEPPGWWWLFGARCYGGLERTAPTGTRPPPSPPAE